MWDVSYAIHECNAPEISFWFGTTWLYAWCVYVHIWFVIYIIWWYVSICLFYFMHVIGIAWHDDTGTIIVNMLSDCMIIYYGYIYVCYWYFTWAVVTTVLEILVTTCLMLILGNYWYNRFWVSLGGVTGFS